MLEKRHHGQACRVNHTEQQVIGSKGKTLAKVKGKVEGGLEKVLKHDTMLPLMASAYSLIVSILYKTYLIVELAIALS